MIRHFVIFLCLAALTVRAETSCDKLTVAGIAEFTAAHQAWDGARFTAATDFFQQATTNYCASVTNFYWLGTAQFYRMLQLKHSHGSSTNQVSAEVAMDAAIDALKSAVTFDANHAESHALLSALYGMKINGSLIRAARFGPHVGKHRDAAMASVPDNPRVQYLLGICQFQTANKQSEWRKALTTLLLADKLFTSETSRPPQPLEPRWGRSGCLTFIGRTYESLDELVKSEEYFRKALAEHPADVLAQDGLRRVAKKK